MNKREFEPCRKTFFWIERNWDDWQKTQVSQREKIYSPVIILKWVKIDHRALKVQNYNKLNSHVLLSWSFRLIWTHRCWWQMLKTKSVGDNVEMLVNDLLPLESRQHRKKVTNILILSPTSKNCQHHKVTNIPLSLI